MASSTTAARPKASGTRTARPATSRAKKPVTTTPAKEAQSESPIRDFLDSYKFTYELVELDITSINRKQSELNQARIAKPIDEDVVVLYAEQMRDGAKFPPIVVHADGSSYIVMDGNHRVAAADLADVSTLSAYLVKNPSPAAVRAFTYEANTRHGLPTSLQDRIFQAIHLIEIGVKAVDAARQLGLPLNKVRDAWDIHEANKRFDSLGVKRFERLTQTARRRLSTIYLDSTLKAAAELVLDAGIGGDDLQTFVRQINAVRNEKDQKAVIEQWRESRATTIKATAGGRVPLAQSLQTFARVTSTINRMSIDTLGKDLRDVTPETRVEIARAATESVENLMAVVREIRRMGETGSPA